MTKRMSSSSESYERRVRLFRIWESEGNASVACQQTGISRGTFYYWKGRFLAEGYAGLAEKTPRPPRQVYESICPCEILPEVHAEIIAIKKQFPGWSIARIAQRANQTRPVCSEITPSLVRMVLLQANLWCY